MMNRAIAALARKVEAEHETICRGQPCPACKVAWLDHELNHLPGCRHLRDAAIVDRAILADELV